MGNNKRKRRKRSGMSKVKKDIKWLKKNVEFKSRDQTFTDEELSTTVVPVRLNLMGTGDTVSAREGNMIAARRILVRGFVSNDNGTPVDCVCRIMLVRQKQSAGTALAIGDVLLNATVNGPRNLDLASNIVVYADETFSMDLTTHSLIPFKFIFKLNNQVRYGTTAATEAGLEQNGINLIGISTVATGANAPTMTFDARFSFCDS